MVNPLDATLVQVSIQLNLGTVARHMYIYPLEGSSSPPQ